MNVQATVGIDAHEQGLAAGLLGTSMQTGGALMIAIVSAVISSRTVAHGGNAAAGVLASITPVVTILIPVALVGAVAVLALVRVREHAGAVRPSAAAIELALAEEAAAL